MKDLGFIVRWGRVFPGYEKHAIDLFSETTKYFGDKLADGTLTYFEPFLYLSGDSETEIGFFVMKGPEPKVLALIEDPGRLDLQARATQLLAHVKTDVLAVGEGVFEQIGRFGKANQVLIAV